MISSLNNRLLSLIEAKKTSINALSKAIGVPQTTLNKAIKSTEFAASSILVLILDYFPDVSAEWLMRGKGDMFASQDDGGIVINNSNVSQHGNGNAIGNSNNNGTSADILAVIREKDQVIAAKDARITELTDHIIRLTTK